MFARLALIVTETDMGVVGGNVLKRTRTKFLSSFTMVKEAMHVLSDFVWSKIFDLVLFPKEQLLDLLTESPYAAYTSEITG